MLRGLDGGFGYIFYVSGLVFHASKAKLGNTFSRTIFRSAEKTFFFSACRGRGVCMLSESSTQTVARRSANAPFLRYLGRKGTLNRNAFLRGGTPRMLTCSVLPCVGRGLIRHYESRNAGQAGILYFSRCARIAYLRRRRGKGTNKRATRRWDCHIDTWNIDRYHSGLGMSSVGVLMAFGSLV